MAYSGMWKNSPAAALGEDSRNFTPRDNWGEGADPRHDVQHPHDQWSDVPFPGPVQPQFREEIPPQIEDQYDVSRLPPTFPMPYHEPDGHDGIETAPWGVGDWRAQNANNTARSVDRGMPKFFQTREIVGRSVTQTHYTGPEESLPGKTGDNPTDGEARRALRGFNGLDLNNPGSSTVNFSGNYRRQGKEIVAWSNRWMPRRTITHTKRILHLNLAATAMPSAGPEGDSYSPYTSPYDGRVTNMPVGTSSPMMRREPRQWDENTITDGSGQDDSYQFNSWGL